MSVARNNTSVPGASVRDHGEPIGYLLKQLSMAFRRRMDERLRIHDLGLSTAHMAALFALIDEPGLAGAELARRTLISAQAMHGVLKRLEEDGYIHRVKRPDNQRIDCWNLTTRGSMQLARARKAAGPILQKMLNGLAAEERRVLRNLLERCIVSLESSSESGSRAVTSPVGVRARPRAAARR